MMEVHDGKRVFIAAPNPPAIYSLSDPKIGDHEIDVGNLPTQALLDVIDFFTIAFGGAEAAEEKPSGMTNADIDRFKPSDLIRVAGLALVHIDPELTPQRLGAGHPSAVVPFVRAILGEQIMPQARTAFSELNLKND